MALPRQTLLTLGDPTVGIENPNCAPPHRARPPGNDSVLNIAEMADHQQTVTAPKLRHQPPFGRFWESIASVLNCTRSIRWPAPFSQRRKRKDFTSSKRPK
jgi:hypothetical protein